MALLNKDKSTWILAPVFGTVLFVLLYIVATRYYPGGSQFEKNSIGFSWTTNYWCNLLNENAINGQHNAAKPIAITAMFVLCLTLGFFWHNFPRYANLNKPAKLIIRWSGLLAMTTALFLFTNLEHDQVTNLASSFGVVATIGTLIGLYNNKWYWLFVFGLLNVLLVGLNNYVYYNEELLIHLPLIQKITFASFLLWICCISIKLYQSSNKPVLRIH